ncbi:MAG: SBBP repeat-containing protein [Ignavibacteria bacterium]
MNSIKIIYSILLSLLFLNHAESQVTQEWAARYNGPPGNNSDFAYAMAVDGSGNVYVTGYSVGVGTGSYDYATIKYNSSGVEQWARRYNGTANGTDYAYAIAVDAAGNVYVTGGSVGFETNYYDYATVKYDAAGVEQWVRRYDNGGGDIASLIAVDGSGNIFVTGYSSGSGAGDDYLTIKYNSSGSQIWVARYGGVFNGGYERPYSLALDGAGNIYVTGESSDSSFHADYATVKYNPSGVLQWAARYNGTGNSHDYAFSVAIAPSGNVYVTGSSTGIGTNADYATIQYSPTGVQQWVQRYNFLQTSVPDEAYSIAVDGSDNVYVTGYSSKTFGNYDYATIKYNSDGDSLWVKRYNGSVNWNDVARSLVIDGSANVYVTGYSREFTGGDNYTTIKYNSSGIQQWLTSYTGSINNSEDARSIALDGAGNVYVTGYSSTDTTLWDYATVKYTQTVGINQISIEIPEQFKLEQNYPNPFNPVTNLEFAISDLGFVSLKVYDVNGREVAILVNEQLQPGTYKTDFNGSNFTSGIYFYRLETNEFIETKKMILVK